MKKSEKCVTHHGGGCCACVRSSWTDLRMLIELHNILFSSAITIIANRRGWRHSPCELVCTLPSWPGTKWKELLRGQREHTTEFPERCEEGTGGGAEAPFVTQALWTPASALTFCDGTVCVNESWPLWCGDQPGSLRAISSCHLLSPLRHLKHCENLALGSCPPYYAATTSPPSLLLSLWPLFWQDTGCQLQL